MPADTPSGSVERLPSSMTAKVPPWARLSSLSAAAAALPSWSMSSLSQTTLVPPLSLASATSSAPAAARRSGAKGCGVSAAAVERASDGASMRAAKLFAVLAVGTMTTARLLPSGLGDDAIDHAHALVPAGGGSPAIVDDYGDRAGAFEPARFARRVPGPARASATMSSAAASRRNSVTITARRPASFPGFRDRRGCASAGKVILCGLGGTAAEQPIDDGQRCQGREQPGVEER